MAGRKTTARKEAKGYGKSIRAKAKPTVKRKAKKARRNG
jgi:hypothetical protein